MGAGYYTMSCEVGATFTLEIEYTDSEGEPIDLTGQTALMNVEDSAGNEITVFSTSDMSIVLDENVIYLVKTAAETAEIPAGNYFYDLVLINGPVKTRLIEGQFIIKPGVTE